MSAQIDLWLAEHRNFRNLLNIMEKELSLFHRGERPNYELLLDITYYMTHYPDLFHHPKEDVAFARIAKRGSAAWIAQSHHEHRVIAQSGDALQAQLDAVIAGLMLSRVEVESPARRYIEYFRRHMEREERALFPLARQVLGDADWQWIDAHCPQGADPLFGDAVHERYRVLQGRIAAEVGCDCELAGPRVS